MQEGTLKHINKDRNQKTTRNIQLGLPFTIDEVKRQTEDLKVLEAVSVIKIILNLVEKLTCSDHVCSIIGKSANINQAIF